MTRQEHKRGEALSLEGQGEPLRAGKEDGEGDDPAGHPCMDTHVRLQGWTEREGKEKKSKTLLHSHNAL